MEEIITVSGLCKLLALDPNEVRFLLQWCHVPTHRVGRNRVISRRYIDQMQKARDHYVIGRNLYREAPSLEADA